VVLTAADIGGLGTIATQNANSVAITGGTIDNTVIGGTTPAAGTFTTVTTPIVGAATGSSTTGLDLNVNSKAQARVVEVGDGTRPLVINGGSAGGAQTAGITATTVLAISGGGGNPVRFYTNGRVTTQQLEVSHTASAVNYVQVTGGATTKAVVQSSQGSDSNISFVTQTKGTGAIDLAAGSSGVNISNGGTVTAITRTAGGSAYATAPTVAISAPTTDGGVQATATCTVTAGSVNTTFTITNAGSGYVEQPTITFSGGGGSGAAAFATVGSGTTIKSLGSTISLSTASGEQVRIAQANPPVNYLQMQGNSSSSSPILSVQGTDTNIGFVVSSKGSSGVRFFTNNLSHLQLDVSHTASAVNYLQVTGAATGGRPTISAQGSDTNVNFVVASKGSGSVGLRTDSSTTQVSVIHTASAVNFLTLTGSAAGSSPVIASAGSDTNIDINLTPKGTGNVVASAGQIYQNNLSMLGMALIMA
jgi:hypothetical protein